MHKKNNESQYEGLLILTAIHITICLVLLLAICLPPCENGVCERPDICVCEPGWVGSRCRIGKEQVWVLALNLHSQPIHLIV